MAALITQEKRDYHGFFKWPLSWEWIAEKCQRLCADGDIDPGPSVDAVANLERFTVRDLMARRRKADVAEDPFCRAAGSPGPSAVPRRPASAAFSQDFKESLAALVPTGGRAPKGISSEPASLRFSGDLTA